MSDGNVRNAVVDRVDLDRAADQSLQQRELSRVNHVVAFTTELRTWLVFHNEHYVRYNQQSISSVLSTTLELVLGRNKR